MPHGDQLYAPSLGTNGSTLAPYLPGGLYGLNCPAVGGCTKSQAFPKPPEVQALLDSRPNRELPATIAHVPNYLGPKTLSNDVTSIQLLAGLEGEFPGRDWTWELYTSHGSSRSQVQTGGTTRLEGFRWMVNQPNYAKGLQYTGNPLGSGFGAGTVYCTSGLPIFYGVNGWTEAAFPFVNPTEGVPTQDCMNTLIAHVKDNGEMTQNVTEFNLQGRAFDMWAGEARFAAGVSHRENTYEYIPDTLVAHSAILDSAAGIYPANPSSGSIAASDIYGEFLVPLLAGRPGVQDLTLGDRLPLLRQRSDRERRNLQGHARLAHHRSSALPRRPPASQPRTEYRRAVPIVRAGIRSRRSRRRLLLHAQPAEPSERQSGPEPERSPSPGVVLGG